MLGFFRECRAVSMTRGSLGLLSLPLVVAVLAGAQAHLGLPVDILVASASAGMAMAVGLTSFVLISRVRRREQADRRD
jgi:hypothetical protein